MAINLETQYPGKINPASPAYPYGEPRNITNPGDGTGTPWEAALVRDIAGMMQAFLVSGAVVPSGNPDAADASQYLEAILAIISARSAAVFPTIAAMTAGTPTDGKAFAAKLGQTLSVDGENDLTTVYTVVAVAADVDLGGGLWAKRIDPAAVFKNVAPNATDSKLEYASFNDYIGFLAGKMKAGAEVTIGCFGDSTTDGVGTTGWVMNPTSGGAAVGNSDHNVDAPNAWPLKLQTALRDIYSNNNIKTFNAGYGNQKMEDGWANDNYQAAMIDNPFYGVPDVLLIQFGINDTVTPGSELDNFITQYRILIRRVIDDGTVPVLMTTDAIWSKVTGSFQRPADEAQRELNSAIKSLAAEFNVPVLDMYDVERKWVQDNADGYAWMAIQPDTLHFNDVGHAFKAQVPAMLFFNDAVAFDGGETWVASVSSQCASLGDNSNLFTVANNKQGGNYILGVLADGTDVMTMWVWSTVADAQLVYLGLATEGAGNTTQPSVDVENFIDNAVVSKEIIAAGATYNAGKGKSDIPYIHGKLHYGLNKVVYKSSDAATFAFTGGFRIVEAKSLPSNCLVESGRLSREYLDVTGDHFQLPAEAARLANVAAIWEGERLVIQFKATMPKGCGVLFMSGQGYDGSAAAVTNNMQSTAMLYRTGTDTLEFYNLVTTDLGVDSATILGAASAVLPLTDDFTARLELYKNAGVQTIEIYDAFSGGALLATFTAAPGEEVRYAGHCGGLFANTAINPGANKIVELHEMVIIR